MSRELSDYFNDVFWRKGDLVERLHDQVTFPPVDPVELRLLLDWAADEIERLRG
jgi:hypothetical protein